MTQWPNDGFLRACPQHEDYNYLLEKMNQSQLKVTKIQIKGHLAIRAYLCLRRIIYKIMSLSTLYPTQTR